MSRGHSTRHFTIRSHWHNETFAVSRDFEDLSHERLFRGARLESAKSVLPILYDTIIRDKLVNVLRHFVIGFSLFPLHVSPVTPRHCEEDSSTVLPQQKA